MEEFAKLVGLMETLRGEHGCPWDKKQTEQAFKTFLLEEVYELIEAIQHEDYGAMKEELGDLLFHIVFICQICKEKQQFDIRDVLRAAFEKMYGRHPHVFSPDGDETPVEKRWEEIKKTEKADYSPVSHVPKILPALLRAYVISKRAAKVGFDWEKLEDIHEKMCEEIGELKAGRGSQQSMKRSKKRSATSSSPSSISHAGTGSIPRTRCGSLSTSSSGGSVT